MTATEVLTQLEDLAISAPWLQCKRRLTLTVAMVMLLVGIGSIAHSADDASPTNKEEADEATAIAKTLATEYVFQIASGPEAQLKMIPDPALRWTNQLRRRFYGDVFVWTRKGRPEVVASITNVFGAKRLLETELHSLSLERPVLVKDGKPVWQPIRAGVKLTPIPRAAPPGLSAADRLRQMRLLATQFFVSAEYGDNRQELRLLRTPILRYQSAEPRLLDGALFAFVKGTDPEAFLMIEARGEGSKFQWHFALARFSGNCMLRAMHGEREVWRAERLTSRTVQDPQQPYFAIRGELESTSDPR